VQPHSYIKRKNLISLQK